MTARRRTKKGPPDSVTLHPGREKSIGRGHPWIFSGAVAHVGAEVRDGDIAPVRGSDGALLGRGFVNRKSQIVVRLLGFGDGDADPGEIGRRVAHAVALRDPGPRRMIYAESDGLPGLVVDRYGDWAVMQITTLGMDRLRPVVVDALRTSIRPRGIFERSDGDARKKEGLSPVTGVADGEEPPELIEIEEESLAGPVRQLVDVRAGHKTGTYLDQRLSRARVARYAHGGQVLNAFSYTGGFALHAARAGAKHALNLDTSAEALALAAKSAERAGVAGIVEQRQGDAFAVLRELRASGARFDLVIVDPPKFVESTSHLEAGLRGYRDVNRVAMQIVRPGGFLATFSCSGLVDAASFQRVLWSASREAARPALIVERLGQPEDHPVRLDFPESEYLKGMVLRIE